MSNFDLIELFDTYCTLRDLEDKSDYYGNVDYFMNLIAPQYIKFFDYLYSDFRK